MGEEAPRYARVLLDSPLPQLDRLFDYRIPAALVEAVRPGIRVKVPLRVAGRVADGYVVEVVDALDWTGEVSELDDVVSGVPVLQPEVYTLLRRLADRAAGTVSDLVRIAVPKRAARLEASWLAREPDAPLSSVTPAPLTGYPDALGHLLAAGGRAALDAIPTVAPVPAPPAGPKRRGRAAGPVPQAPEGDTVWVGEWATTLAAAATRALEADGQALLAVPDWRDRAQLLAALHAVLPADRIVHLDATQTPTERMRAFLRCLGPDPVAVVGTRQVVYAPAARLGLIAVWNDGDPLHAEPLAPYVHVRDAALVRHELQGGALLFAGHTRTTDVERLVALGWLQEVRPARVAHPRIVLTGLQGFDDPNAVRARIPSTAWRAAREALDSGPVLVQVGRPGYAPHLVCADCGRQARCRRCDGALRTTTQGAPPSCPLCGALAAGWRCPHCSGGTIRRVGAGSVRTADELGRAFPGVRVVVADGEHPHERVDERPTLVVATRGAEPIAHGGYRAVLLLDGERMLARESLRVAEDCLRWWSDAAALAAPGASVVLVGVDGPAAQALATWGQARHARTELEQRRQLHFPPAVRVATVTGRTVAVETAVDAVRERARDVLGPVELDDETTRAIVRFDYAQGAEVARVLREAVIRRATSRRRAVGGRPGPTTPQLRVRFDDPDPFDQV